MNVEDRSVFEIPYVSPDKTISYGKSEDQVIDFYNATEANNSIIVLIHGGYWRPEYDRKHLAPLARKFAELGWPVALIEYRRIIGNPDAALNDVVSAINEVASEHKNIILIGHSAGGQLALIAAKKVEVSGIIALAPVTNLALAEELDLDEGAVSDFLGAPASMRTDLDPMFQSHPSSPTTLIHGALDIRVPPAFSRDYAERFNIKLIEVENIGHFELIDPRHKVFAVIPDELALFGAT